VGQPGPDRFFMGCDESVSDPFDKAK
jgi:hypothetical protein